MHDPRNENVVPGCFDAADAAGSACMHVMVSQAADVRASASLSHSPSPAVTAGAAVLKPVVSGSATVASKPPMSTLQRGFPNGVVSADANANLNASARADVDAAVASGANGAVSATQAQARPEVADRNDAANPPAARSGGAVAGAQNNATAIHRNNNTGAAAAAAATAAATTAAVVASSTAAAASMVVTGGEGARGVAVAGRVTSSPPASLGQPPSPVRAAGPGQSVNPTQGGPQEQQQQAAPQHPHHAPPPIRQTSGRTANINSIAAGTGSPASTSHATHMHANDGDTAAIGGAGQGVPVIPERGAGNLSCDSQTTSVVMSCQRREAGLTGARGGGGAARGRSNSASGVHTNTNLNTGVLEKEKESSMLLQNRLQPGSQEWQGRGRMVDSRGADDLQNRLQNSVGGIGGGSGNEAAGHVDGVAHAHAHTQQHACVPVVMDAEARAHQMVRLLESGSENL